MEWSQVITLMMGNFAIIWWFRKESREDWKIMHNEWREFKETVRLEMKDFHERLLEIEKRRK